MKWRGLLVGVAIGQACVLAAGSARAAWDWPKPGAVKHPGAEEAPASSPTTYPDEKGFRARAEAIMKGLSRQDLGAYRRGYFEGGDPGKYLPGYAMARLVLNPNDAEARKYMNDDRSYKEHYHFAAVNWARFLPVFGGALTANTQSGLAEKASTYTSYHSGSGTENHKVMWYASALVMPHYLKGDGQLGRMSKDAVLRKMKEWLRGYVKGLYLGGQGEWDSSTYLMFDVNGMLNIYDFSPDPDCRVLAKAALDWYVTAYALKYTDGVYTAPNQRGFASGSVETIADQTGWLWWDSTRPVTAEDTQGFRYTMHAVTSSYRPNGVLTNLARKNLPVLPFESRNSKPNYWGVSGGPKPSTYHETLYVSPEYTMGSLWNGHGSQMTRFQIAARTGRGAAVFTGGHPRKSDHEGNKTGIGFQDGNCRYAQTAQVNRTFICMAQAPSSETEVNYAFFSIPDAVSSAKREGRWFVMQAGKTFVAVCPLTAKAGIVETEPDKKGHKTRMVRMDGQWTGFIVQTADTAVAPSLAAFTRALGQAKVNASDFADKRTVAYTDPWGRSIRMTFSPAEGDDKHGNRPADVTIDGQAVTFGDWPVYHGLYVRQEGGVLTVNDGREGFVVDFSGEMPVYKSWTK